MSYREGLPRNIMELMACGKPVIGTNIRGIRDLIKNDVTGYLVDVGNIQDTADKIEKLYKDRLLRNSLSKACKEMNHDNKEELKKLYKLF